MATDAANHGQAAQAGAPTSGMNTSATAPDPIEINVVVESGSRPTLISAFQPAWQAAANKTARKTKFSITSACWPLVPSARESARSCGIFISTRGLFNIRTAGVCPTISIRTRTADQAEPFMAEGNRIFRIGTGAGFAADRLDAAVDLARRGKLDVMVLECLGERTVAFAHRDRLADPRRGYNHLLDRRMRALLPVCHAARTTIITNMGA